MRSWILIAFLSAVSASRLECLRGGGSGDTCRSGDPVADAVVSSYVDSFGEVPTAVFLAPGRVNLVWSPESAVVEGPDSDLACMTYSCALR